MFHSAPGQFVDFKDSWRRPDGTYGLRDVRLEILEPGLAIFTATAEAPANASAWVRCWVSNAVEGTLAEEVVSGVGPNQEVTLKVQLQTDSIPELACVRIESSQFATEHTLHRQLCKGEIYFLDQLRLELASVESLRDMIDGMDPEMKKELSPRWLEMIENATEPTAWIHGFAVYHHETNERVGSGGFKGPPEDGCVEIAYGIDEPHRGRGYATTVATALTKYAFGQSSGLLKVIAHTLPEENASTKVLTKAGFMKVGEVVDPDDGPVWRWQREGSSC